MATKKNTKKTPKSSKKASKKTTVKPVDNGPMTLSLEELYVYKLKLLNKNFEDAKAAIVAPMKAQFEAELVRRINEALEKDPAVQQATQERTACVNEVLSKVAGDLAPGYAVAEISPEGETITAVFNPDQAGQKVT